jgi:hypothetical protein
MPIHYEIDTQRGLLRSAFPGTVPPTEVRAFYAELRKHPDFRADLDQIADFSGNTPSEWSPDEMRRVVRAEPFGPGARRAFVGPSDLVFGLSRMYSSLATSEGAGGTIAPFRTLAEAEAWLERPKDGA